MVFLPLLSQEKNQSYAGTPAETLASYSQMGRGLSALWWAIGEQPNSNLTVRRLCSQPSALDGCAQDTALPPQNFSFFTRAPGELTWAPVVDENV